MCDDLNMMSYQMENVTQEMIEMKNHIYNMNSQICHIKTQLDQVKKLIVLSNENMLETNERTNEKILELKYYMLHINRYLINLKNQVDQMDYNFSLGFNSIHEDMKNMISQIRKTKGISNFTSRKSSKESPSSQSYSINSNGTAIHYHHK